MIDCKIQWSSYIGFVNRVWAKHFGYFQSHILGQISKDFNTDFTDFLYGSLILKVLLQFVVLGVTACALF